MYKSEIVLRRGEQCEIYNQDDKNLHSLGTEDS